MKNTIGIVGFYARSDEAEHNGERRVWLSQTEEGTGLEIVIEGIPASIVLQWQDIAWARSAFMQFHKNPNN